MVKTILLGFLLLLFCFLMDGIWLGLIANKFYHREIGSLMRAAPLSDPKSLVSILAVYLLMVTGILHFVIFPYSLSSGIFLKGALFGLVLYGVYDFTNYAILKDWTFKVLLADWAWGVFLCGMLAQVGKTLLGLFRG